MSLAKVGKPLASHSEETKTKMSANRAASKTVRVTSANTQEVFDLPSIRRAAVKIGVSHTSLSSHLKNVGLYVGKGYIVNLLFP